jgi:hypothetical protein
MSFRIAAITDEFSPDLETAPVAMADVGMTTSAELRTRPACGAGRLPYADAWRPSNMRAEGALDIRSGSFG